ncbi:MAG: aspartyl-phosphate phosphatase Spo0E family protein [Bacillota bacterium]
MALPMMGAKEPFNIEAEIDNLQTKLCMVWETKGQIDQEILDLSVELDQWLNLYYCQRNKNKIFLDIRQQKKYNTN